MPRLSGILAEVVVGLHVGFVLFVLLGGLLALRWPRVAWLHLPAAVWGALIEVAGWICPLTPLENRLRRASGTSEYAGGFVEHYVLPVLYPTGLTRGVQYVLGAGVLLVNAAVYWWVFRGLRRSSASA
jgi:hypothetical protein